MRCRAALAVLLTVFSVACSRSQRGAPERIALVRFENLSGDANLDWLAAGIPGTIGAQLATSSRFVPLPVSAERDVYAVRAATALYGYYSILNNRISMTADLRDVERQKTLRTIHVDGDAAGAVGLIDRISRELAGGSVEPIGTSHTTACREYWTGMESAKPEEAAAHLNAAIQADPSFVPARVALAERALASGDAQTADAQLAAASASPASLSPYLRARIALLNATRRGDAAGRTQALANLTGLAPANEQAWVALAEIQLARKDFPDAIQSLKTALALDDKNPATLNAIGYAYAFSGNFEAAKDAFENYRKLAPQDANALDSLGDVHFYFGRFAEAERHYLEAHKLNSGLLGGGDLYKAALARAYAGDMAAADTQFADFLQFRKGAGDVILVIREAVWEAQTGRRDRGRKRLEQFLLRTDIPAEVRVIAAAQLDLFNAGTGANPIPLAGPATLPATRALAQLAAFVSQPDASPVEWQRRAGGMASQALGYALLLNRHFAEAAPVWERLYAETSPNFLSDIRVMLAWAYSEAGRGADARKLLAVRPLPPRMAEPGLSFLTFEKDQALRPR